MKKGNRIMGFINFATQIQSKSEMHVKNARLTSGLCDAVTMTPMVALVFLERSAASRPILNMMWSRCLALLLKPAVPYCKSNPSGLGWRLDHLDTS